MGMGDGREVCGETTNCLECWNAVWSLGRELEAVYLPAGVAEMMGDRLYC